MTLGEKKYLDTVKFRKQRPLESSDKMPQVLANPKSRDSPSPKITTLRKRRPQS